MEKYIVIAGNIGAGKSTLVKHLCETLGWQPYYEPVTENPYLEDFYKDMKKWAFHSQLFFLADRITMHKELQDFQGSVVQDRSVYEDAEIFARNLSLQGEINRRDFQTYWKIYQNAVSLLTPPDLVVYLRATVPSLKERIGLRKREFEAEIPDIYLEHLNSLYDDWIRSYSMSEVLILNIEEYDILKNPDDLNSIAVQIKDKLRGGQGELFS